MGLFARGGPRTSLDARARERHGRRCGRGRSRSGPERAWERSPVAPAPVDVECGRGPQAPPADRPVRLPCAAGARPRLRRQDGVRDRGRRGQRAGALLPRPRRFGKTLNLSMLRCFLEKGSQAGVGGSRGSVGATASRAPRDRDHRARLVIGHRGPVRGAGRSRAPSMAPSGRRRRVERDRPRCYVHRPCSRPSPRGFGPHVSA